MRHEDQLPVPNQHLRHARELRGWSQQRLAEAVGTNNVMISRWERGIMAPSPHFRAQLCELFGQTAADLGFIPTNSPIESQETANAPRWHVPFPRNPCFTGREAILVCLHAAFQPARQALVTQALCGLGGVGKTQTAIEYAYRLRNHYAAVLWVCADTRDLLLAELAALAPVLDIIPQDAAEQDQAVQSVKRWLHMNSGWLLIIDNVEDLSLPEQILPTDHHGSVLLTTRSLITGARVRSIPLEGMDPAEGALFLLRRAKLLGLDAPLPDPVDLLYEQALALTTLLGGLPLAIDQAGAYIEETGCSLDGYRSLYHTWRARLLGRRGVTVPDHPASVHTTFTVAFEQLEMANPVAADILRMCGLLHPEAIPEELFRADSTQPEEPGLDPLTLDESLMALRRFALIQREPATKSLSLHRLVQAVLIDSMDEKTRQQWIGRVVQSMNRIFPDSSDETTWTLCQRLLPHAQVCVTHIGTLPVISLAAGHLLSKLGAYCGTQGRYPEAESLLLRALTILHATVEECHPMIATCLNDLAITYNYQGRLSEAEPLYRRALAIRQALFDDHHPVMVESLHNLGYLYMGQGKYAQAVMLLEQAVSLGEALLGAEHLKVAGMLHNLGALYAKQGRFAEAEALFQRALVIRREELGDDHSRTLSTMSWVAIVSGRQGKFTQAEVLHRQILARRELRLDPTHVEVGESLHYLAWLAHEQGRYAEAEPLYQRALAIRKQALGPIHPLTLQTRHHLARLTLDCGHDQQAEVLGQEVLRQREETLGADHPEIVESLDLLSQVYRRQGRAGEAETLAGRAQTIRSQGMETTPQHPEAKLAGSTSVLMVQQGGRQ